MLLEGLCCAKELETLFGNCQILGLCEQAWSP